MSSALVVAAVASVAQSLPQPSAIWPTTVAGWMSLFLGFSSIIGVLYTLHRFAQKPLEQKVGEAREALDRDLNAFREAVSGQMNGFGRRLDIIEGHNRDTDSTVNGLLQAVVETRQDRKYTGEALIRIEHAMERLRSEHNAALGRILEILAADRGNGTR